MNLSIGEMKDYLISCGYTKSQCDKMDEEEIRMIYSRLSKLETIYDDIDKNTTDWEIFKDSLRKLPNFFTMDDWEIFKDSLKRFPTLFGRKPFK